MNRIAIALLLAAAVAAGFLAGQRWPAEHTRPTPTVPPVARALPSATSVPLPDVKPKLSAAQVSSHREDFYSTMSSIDDVLELPNDFAQTEALYALAGRADADELNVLIAQATAIADRSERSAALQILYLRFWEVDPHAALRHLEDSDLDIGVQILGSVFLSWAKVDANSAIAAANGISDARQRRVASQAILEAYSRIDAGMLASIAQQLDDDYDLNAYTARAISNIAAHSPHSALQQALEMTHSRHRHGALASVGHIWARTQPQDALAWASQISDDNARRVFTSAVIDRWSADDPDSAIGAVMALPDGPQKEQLMATAMRNLANQNPHDALALAASLSGNNRERVHREIYQTWLGTDLQGAIDSLSTLPDSPANTRILQMAATIYVHKNADAALHWASQLPMSRRMAVLEPMLGRIGENSPQQALELAGQLSERARSQMTRRVISRWAVQDPAAAARWVQSNDDAAVREDALSHIASQWARQDPVAAGQWALSMRAGDARDTTLANVVMAGRSSVAQTLRLLGAISSQEQRLRATEAAYALLRAGNDAAGDDLLRRAPISDQQRASLRARYGPG